MWNCWRNLQIDKRKLKWEYMRMNIKKPTKPKIYMISPQTVVIYSPLKSRKKWKRSSKTLLPWSRDIIRDFHFNTEWQLFYLPIELTQINLKVQTHTNAFLTQILGPFPFVSWPDGPLPDQSLWQWNGLSSIVFAEKTSPSCTLFRIWLICLNSFD